MSEKQTEQIGAEIPVSILKEFEICLALRKYSSKPISKKDAIAEALKLWINRENMGVKK